MGLTPGAQSRLAVVIADVLGEGEEVSRGVARFLDAYIRAVPLQAALGLRLAIWAVTWLPLLFVGRLAAADGLTTEVRRVYLRRWAESRVYVVREAFYLFKAIALMGWGSQETVRARIGVEPLVSSAAAAGRVA
jgi:hypothetical protein